MRLAGRCDEADEIVRPLLYPHPADAEIMVAYALNAVQRADWQEALHRWDAVAAAYPELPASDFNRALVLRSLDRLDECDAVLCALKAALPDDDDVFYQWSLNPHYMRDWKLAAERWTEFRSRRPGNPAGYAWGAGALRELGGLEEAKALLDMASDRFPGNVQVGIEAALLSGRCGDWDDALRRWDALHAADPHDPELAARREEARLLASYARVDEENGDVARADAAVGAEAGTPERQDVCQAPARSILFRPGQLLLEFESLGSDCEVGLFQRHHGCEPLGLLRWGGPVIDDLIVALERRFAGLGDAGSLRLEETPSEYLLHDDTYRFMMHTFIPVDAAKAARIRDRLGRRMIFLRRILIEQIAAGGRIFVFKDVLRSDRSMILELHRQMRRLGPANLLVVQTARAGCDAADVEQLQDGLFLGYVSAFGNRPLNADGGWNIRKTEWLNLFRIVHAAVNMR